ncbi:MAG: T9SS type A sorting domain-containing protein [Cytophagales bacterium]|nr:T9SS type A sorting domain-containing protein [Cytophagales bacterium]
MKHVLQTKQLLILVVASLLSSGLFAKTFPAYRISLDDVDTTNFDFDTTDFVIDDTTDFNFDTTDFVIDDTTDFDFDTTDFVIDDTTDFDFDTTDFVIDDSTDFDFDTTDFVIDDSTDLDFDTTDFVIDDSTDFDFDTTDFVIDDSTDFDFDTTDFVIDDSTDFDFDTTDFVIDDSTDFDFDTTDFVIDDSTDFDFDTTDFVIDDSTDFDFDTTDFVIDDSTDFDFDTTGLGDIVTNTTELNFNSESFDDGSFTNAITVDAETSEILMGFVIKVSATGLGDDSLGVAKLVEIGDILRTSEDASFLDLAGPEDWAFNAETNEFEITSSVPLTEEQFNALNDDSRNIQLVIESKDGAPIANSDRITDVEEALSQDTDVTVGTSAGNIHVTSNEEVTVTIYNTLGQAVSTSTVNGSGTISTNGSTGVHIVVVESAAGATKEKVVLY